MSLTDSIKAHAQQLGFDRVGVAPAVSAPGVTHLHAWLQQGYAGEMRYMQRHATAREHPRHVLDGVRSVIVVAMNYRTAEPKGAGTLEGRISRYAWGDDYHDIMRRRLHQLARFIQAELPECRARAVVDTAPLLERDFALLAGVGWIGKNTMLINKQIGSWLLLGALLIDAELEYDQPHAPDHCGTCTRCLEACPTQAFAGPYQLDSRRCISYLTIELRGPIPPELRPGLGNWLFGCDVCQDVCPWNRKAPQSDEPAYQPRTSGGAADLERLAAMSDAELRASIAGSPMTRAGLRGLRRNVAVVLGNSASPEARPSLMRLAQNPDPVVREAAEWALNRIDPLQEDRGSRMEESKIEDGRSSVDQGGTVE